ncbi:MAG: ATP-binding protein [Xanthobacteraceae bacterium]
MRRGWRRLLPQRIGGQITVLVVTALAIANLATAVTVFLLNPHPSFLNSPFAAMTKLAVVAKLIDAAPPQTRAAILDAARASLPELSEARSAAAPDQPAPSDPMSKDLQVELGDRFAVLASRSPADAGQHYPTRVSIWLPDGSVLSTPLPEFRRGPGGPTLNLIGTLLFLAIAFALLLVWAARALAAPLTRFADAAERFKVETSDPPLAERGPLEVRRAAAALNDMRARIRRLVDDRTRMLAAVSHDLRTPITRLRLRAEEIEQEPLRRQVVRDLETMQAMVQSALAFLRDQTTPAHRLVVDLPALMQTVCDDFGDVGCEIGFVGPAHLHLECDPDRLTRAVSNLIDNALKFGTVVTVRLHKASAGEVAIDVEDDGPGIPEPEKERVLEPFHRGDAARGLNERDSFGLGLSIARAIAESQGGTLALLDREPSGLVARLLLPAGNQAAVPATIESKLTS